MRAAANPIPCGPSGTTGAAGTPEPRLREQARFTPWPDRDPDMAEAVSRLADREGISTDDQHAWAVESHAKARAAHASLAAEIVNPGGIELDGDPFTRRLSRRTCARASRITGTITTANTSVAADGAAFVLVISEAVLHRLAPRFALRVVEGATVGDDPEVPAIAPVKAIRDRPEEGPDSMPTPLPSSN